MESLREGSSYPENESSRKRKRKRGSGPGEGESGTWRRPTRIRLGREDRDRDRDAGLEKAGAGEVHSNLGSGESQARDEEARIEEVVNYMLKEELVDTTSSDTEEHYMRIRREKFQEVRNKRKRDRSPSSRSSMELEDSQGDEDRGKEVSEEDSESSDGTEEFLSTWGSWGLKAREDHKAQERSRKEKKEKVRRDLAKCMEVERKLIRGGVQAHYGEYAGKGSKGDHKGNQEEAEATGLWLKLMSKPDEVLESVKEEERDEEGPLAGRGGSGFSIKWVDAKHQAADDWTKGLFTEQKRDEAEGSELAGEKEGGERVY